MVAAYRCFAAFHFDLAQGQDSGARSEAATELSTLITHDPSTCSSYKLQSKGKSVGWERLAVDDFRAPPKFVLRRLDNQVSVPLQWPKCSDSHAMRTDVVCRGGLCDQRLRHAREQHWKSLAIALFFPILVH